jgi:integrase
VRLHDLLHVFATIIVNAETNPRVVSDLPGHAIVAVTLQTYFHPNEDAAAEAITRPDRLLGWTGS